MLCSAAAYSRRDGLSQQRLPCRHCRMAYLMATCTSLLTHARTHTHSLTHARTGACAKVLVRLYAIACAHDRSSLNVPATNTTSFMSLRVYMRECECVCMRAWVGTLAHTH